PPRARVLVACLHRKPAQLQQHARYRLPVRLRVHLPLAAHRRMPLSCPERGGTNQPLPGCLPDSAGVRLATSMESRSPAGSSEVNTEAGRLATVAWSTLPTNFQPAGILTKTKPVGGSTKTA